MAAKKKEAAAAMAVAAATVAALQAKLDAVAVDAQSPKVKKAPSIPLPTIKAEELGDRWAYVPLFFIIFGTLGALFFSWPPQHLWTPPINHNAEFNNWQYNYPPPDQPIFHWSLPSVAAFPGQIGVSPLSPSQPKSPT
jgi:hypothetical protein